MKKERERQIRIGGCRIGERMEDLGLSCLKVPDESSVSSSGQVRYVNKLGDTKIRILRDPLWSPHGNATPEQPGPKPDRRAGFFLQLRSLPSSSSHFAVGFALFSLPLSISFSFSVSLSPAILKEQNDVRTQWTRCWQPWASAIPLIHSPNEIAIHKVRPPFFRYVVSHCVKALYTYRKLFVKLIFYKEAEKPFYVCTGSQNIREINR